MLPELVLPAVLLVVGLVGSPSGQSPGKYRYLRVSYLLTAAMLLCLKLTRWCEQNDHESWITASWSLLGFCLFGLGLGGRERVLRLAGLCLVGVAFLRVVCYDVWRLDTGARILSFLVLGAALLGLGFLYNRFQETIKKWL